MEFKKNNFLQYSRAQKISPLIWLILFFGMLMIIALTIFEMNNSKRIIMPIFLLVVMILIILFFYSVSYFLYSSGIKLLNEISEENSILIKDIRVFVKNYDLFKKYILGQNLFNATLYEFNFADLLLNENSIILLGKMSNSFFHGHVSPIELIYNIKNKHHNFAQIISVLELNDGRVQFIINDPNYKNDLKIQFGSNVELQKWVSNKIIKQSSI